MLFSALSTPCSQALENSLSILRPHVPIWKWGPYLFCARCKGERRDAWDASPSSSGSCCELRRAGKNEEPRGISGKAPALLKAAWKTQTSVEKGKMVFSQHSGAAQLITSDNPEQTGAIRACFHPRDPAQMLPGFDIFQEGYRDGHCPSSGHCPEGPARLPGRQESMTCAGQVFPVTNLLQEDGAQCWDWQWPCLRDSRGMVLQGRSCPRSPEVLQEMRCSR